MSEDHPVGPPNIKTLWKATRKDGESLRQFARRLASTNFLAADWLAHKKRPAKAPRARLEQPKKVEAKPAAVAAPAKKGKKQ